MAPSMPAVLPDSMMVPVVVSIPFYLNFHHGWAPVSHPVWSHLATVKCHAHAPTCCWGSTPGWPNAFLLGWHSASCWLLVCSTSVTSSFTMHNLIIHHGQATVCLYGWPHLSMVGPTWPLPTAVPSLVAVKPLLYGPQHACCVA
jgi:hypothetical protein